MSRRRPPRTTARRLLVAGLVTVLGGGAALVPTSAAHAVRTPDVPSVKAVAKIYPHVAGGERLLTDWGVEIYGKTCTTAPTSVPKATNAQGDYYAAESTPQTRKTPTISLRAIRFPSLKKARLFTARYDRWAARCLRDEGQTRNVRFKVDLGDAAWGRSIRLRPESGKIDANIVLVRQRKLVVTTITGSQSGKLPRPAKAIRLAELTLRKAR